MNSSATSDINSTFNPPDNILYRDFQATDITAVNSVEVAQFTIRDGAGTDPDPLGTTLTAIQFNVTGSSLLRRIALYDGTTELGEVPTGSTASFSALTLTAPDDGSKTFSIRVTFQSTVSDNSNFRFTVNSANAAASGSLFATADAGGAQSSMAGDDNRIEVLADRLIITTQAPATAFVLTNLSITPVVQARDVNGNTDLDYVTSITVSNAAGIPMDALGGGNTVAPVAGVATFPAAFQYRDRGNGTLTLTSGSLINAVSTPVAVSYDNNNRINPGALVEPATISSLSTSAPGTDVFDFVIVDDNGSGGDGSPTRFTTLTITQGTGNDIGNWTEALAGATLTVGASTLTGAIASNTITFSGLANSFATDPGFIADNGDKTYTLRVWLRTALGGTLRTTIDNQNLVFDIAESGVALVTVGTPASSDFTAAGTQLQTSGNNNQVSVVANALAFTNPSAPQIIGLNVTFASPLRVEARDANSNVDLDYTGIISSSTTTATAADGPVGGVFAAGVYNFPANYRYTTDAGGVVGGGTITLTSAGPINGTSPTITIQASTSSVILEESTFTYNLRIPYISAANQTLGSGSTTLAAYRVVDGNPSDGDLANTIISSITFNITSQVNSTGPFGPGSTAIKQIGLFTSGGTLISSQPYSGAPSVTFSGLSISANDDSFTTFLVKAAYNNTAAAIGDRDVIRLVITDVNQTSESSKFGATGSIVGANYNSTTETLTTASTPTPVDRNIINVVATRLDFMTQPANAFAGVNEPYGSAANPTVPVVHARDVNQLIDLEIHNVAGLIGTTGGSPLAVPSPNSINFVNGILTLTGVQYTSVGKGTLRITQGALTSDAPSISSNNVDVLDVGATNIAAGGASGITTTTNLAGGSVNRVIYGATFSVTSNYQVAPHPDLSSFRISFGLTAGQRISDIFTNFRVFENSTASFGGPNITTLTGSLTIVDANGNPDINGNQLRVSFATPRDLTTPKSYFLQVDVVPTANGSTPSVRPEIIDGGFGSVTNSVIATTQGSASANAQGQAYSFSAIFPPSLVSSYPASGQLNVATDQPTISLTFSVPVWSFGIANSGNPNPFGFIKLNYKLPGSDSVITVQLTATNGRYLPPPAGLANLSQTINYTLPTLLPDQLYYITIDPGRFDGSILPASANNRGIMDQAGNLFPGISYSGTLYFKTASPFSPNLLSTPVASSNPSITNPSVNGAIINATFDQAGKSYYLVLPTGTSTPTPREIYGLDIHPLRVAQGNFNINQIAPTSQFGSIVPVSGQLTVGATYDVWVAAESFSEKDGIKSSIPTLPSAHFGQAGTITKPGTITTNVLSDTVRGFGTTFTSLRPGRSLFDATGTTFIGTIASITNNTTLVLAANAQVGLTNVAYRVSGFEIGATGPTLQFTVPATPTSLTLNNPTISICNDAFQILNQPIIISESTLSNEFSGTLGVDQTLNFVLPAGFVFDVTLNAGVPKYGSLTLIGSDFTGGGNPQLAFVGNTIARISFRNNGNASADKIILSGLRVLGTGSATGTIQRFGGTAIPSINDLTPVATISSVDAAGITFTNSYSLQQFGNSIVTTIPDNFDDNSIAQPLVAQLIPQPPFGDYGPSIFSGPGVNVNILNLTAVTLNTPFNITINHVDNNGCPSETSIQYTVYDGERAIIDLLPQYCIINPSFTISNPAAIAPGKTHDVFFDKLQSYYLDTLVASIPSFARDATDASPDPNDQLIFGSAWQTRIQNQLLTRLTPGFNPANNPVAPNPYFNYRWDEAVLLNTVFPNTALGTNIRPYDFFRALSPNNAPYYSGGSLGIVQFTGTYQSIANAAVRIPLVQNVRFFVPPVPIIETSTPISTRVVGPNTIPVFCQQGGKFVITGYPQASPGSSVGKFSLKDLSTNTVFYANDLILNVSSIVNASPNTTITFAGNIATPTGKIVVFRNGVAEEYNRLSSTATSVTIDLPFSIASASTINSIQVDINQNGFEDLLTGTANIDPTLIFNSYNEIEITYTYKDNNSPCEGTAKRTIQVTPNPVANFLPRSITNINVPNANQYCEDNRIVFDGSSAPSGSTLTGDATATITNYNWNFGDPNATAAAGPNPNTINGQTGVPLPISGGIGDRPEHFYTQANNYTISLNVVSNYGCPSTTVTKSIDVGNILDANFKFVGISTNDNIAFTNTTTVPGGETIQTHRWNFGVPGPLGSGPTPTKKYTNAGHYKVLLTISTALGCADTVSRPIVILPYYVANAKNSYVREGRFQKNNGGWQSYTTPRNPSLFNSWAWGNPNGAIINLPANDSVWVTNLTGNYQTGERSALYSPSFDTRGLQRPMVSFNSFVQLAANDGVVLEYSTDNKNVVDPTKVWKVLGRVGDGVGWYNAQNIASKPGDQTVGDIGWSGITNTNWQDSKFALVETGTSNVIREDTIVFRFALASQAGGREGFALDNFRLGERTRTILLESFANVANSSPAEKAVNSFIRKYNASTVGLEVVKFNYHVGFPGADPFNQDNPGDPSSRALYYNIETTPRSRLDGQAEPNPNQPLFTQWGPGEFNKRSLQLAQAELFIRPDLSNTDRISFTVHVKPTVKLDNKTVLYAGVLEELVPKISLGARQDLIKSGEDTVEFVVKKMLPSVLGIKTSTHPRATAGELTVPTALPPSADTTYVFGPFTWVPEPSLFYAPNTDDLAIGVFLQNEDTKEIYQSEIVFNLDDPVVTVTSLEDLLPEDVLAYPNPANEQLTVELPARFDQPIRLRMVDQLGRALEAGNIPTGETKQTIDTSNLAAGMYLLQLEGIQGTPVRKKVIIVH